MVEDARDLADIFRRLIATTGPISLMQFMGESNARYYAGQEAIGAGGDFVTAPEISQMFGELVGLWLADIWVRKGRPSPVHYVELGPGRGTLARDVRRAMASVSLSPDMHLIETSARMRQQQCALLPGVIHHDDLASVPDTGPILLVANEFLDALPVRQLVRTKTGWREIMVANQGDSFVEVPGQRPMDSAVPEARRDAPLGTVLETCAGAATVVEEVAARLVKQGGAALFIDYGYTDGRSGSSLQAVRGHEKLLPLSAPGKADLSAHVDFATLAQVAQARGCQWFGTITQSEFLTALGIHARTNALSKASPQNSEALKSARDRLIAPEEMGTLFKVLALAAPDWPTGAAFG